MSLTYAFADLHGRFDLLEQAIEAIEEHAGDNPATVISLGDYIDRGPQSRQIIERLMGGLGDKLKLISLKGNHEDMMYQTIRKPLQPSWWVNNGGGQTLNSYGRTPMGKIDLSIVPSGHLDWIRDLPLLHCDKHRVYVHAAVDPHRSLEEQVEEAKTQDEPYLLWDLYYDADCGHGDRHVVHGHHQHKEGPVLKKKRTNLDTFAWFTGRLVIGVFDDDKAGGPVEFITIKGEPSEIRF